MTYENDRLYSWFFVCFNKEKESQTNGKKIYEVTEVKQLKKKIHSRLHII